MGTRGPVPNRTGNHSRERDAKRRGTVDQGMACVPNVPEINPDWCNVCQMFWNAALNSGQAHYYQETDWVYLYSLLEDLDAAKSTYTGENAGRRPPAQLLATIYTAMSNLLLTEGDRRRLKLELNFESEQEEDAAVVAIDMYKKKLSQRA